MGTLREGLRLGLTINSNLSGLQSGNQASRASNLLSRSLEKLASASRITRAGDDAAGLAIADRFNTQVRQSRVEINNLQSGISAAQTADSGLEVQQQATQRLRELALQASNGTLTDDQRAAINTEAQQLIEQVGQVAEGTNFNQQDLLKQNTSVDLGTEGSVQLDLNASTASSLGLDSLDFSSAEGAANAVNGLDQALNNISSNRSSLGAQVNRFSSAIEQRETQSTNAAESESRIRDLDIARESINKSQAQILQQTSYAGIIQANINSQSALRLL